MTPRLHIGDQNYSSWSMRPWLALRHAGVTFETVLHHLPADHDGPPAFTGQSPTGLVPWLEIDGASITESLAICEWAAEQGAHILPRDATQRALARSAAAIMHAGFPHLRREAPMNIRRRSDASRMTAQGLADAARMDEYWTAWRKRSGGPFLFGDWSIADAMYAPAATRFVTYDIPRSTTASDYIEAVLAEPYAADWIAAAHTDPRTLPRVDLV